MSFADHMRKTVRLMILRVLLETPGFRGNSSVLFDLLNQIGYAVGREGVKDEFRWLAGERLVLLEDAGSVLLATLTEQGQDVAGGFSFVDGVARKVI